MDKMIKAQRYLAAALAAFAAVYGVFCLMSATGQGFGAGHVVAAMWLYPIPSLICALFDKARRRKSMAFEAIALVIGFVIAMIHVKWKLSVSLITWMLEFAKWTVASMPGNSWLIILDLCCIAFALYGARRYIQDGRGFWQSFWWLAGPIIGVLLLQAVTTAFAGVSIWFVLMALIINLMVIALAMGLKESRHNFIP